MRLPFAILSLFLLGCSPSRSPSLPQPAPLLEGSRWHQVRFFLGWPEGREPDFPSAMLIAYSVVQPALEAHGSSIYLWRFHQRALRDSGGHQLTFFAFLPDAAFQQVVATVRATPLLDELQREGIVARAEYTPSDVPDPQELGGVSDPSWPSQLQSAWPLFANGASAAWLALVDQFAVQRCPKATTLHDLQPCFQKVFADVDVMWRIHGQHAFLHHLNAIFSYRPVYLKKDTIF